MQQSTSIGQTLSEQPLPFIDSINQRSYRLLEGKLYSQNFSSLQLQQIPLSLSTETAQNWPPQGLTVVSGEVVANTDRTIISANGEVSILRSPLQICDGSRWEWYAPLSLQGVHLGICKIQQSEQYTYQLFEFNSSTSRTVSFAVEGDQLRVWVNGNKPNKSHAKTITYDSLKNRWYPCVKLEQKGNTIIYLPFSTLAPSNPTSSIYNPLGKIYTQQPSKIQKQAAELPSVPIRNVFQLCRDKILVVWSNNIVKIISRNSQTLLFEFCSFAVHNNQAFNLFSASEYGLLQQWRKDQPLFEFSNSIPLLEIYQWIQYLISALDQEAVPRLGTYKLLLTKLALIRPYLSKLQIKIPNLLGCSDFDVQNYRRVFKYFTVPSYQFSLPATLFHSNTQWKIQGEILDVTQHYLVTRHQKTLILYNLQDSVKQVFRQSLEKRISFSKKALIQNFEEGDVRSLKNQEFFLYKILAGCLQKDKRKDQNHAVNQNDLRELVRDYGISEGEAREALLKTGQLEDALVWIHSDRTQNLKVDSYKEIEEEGTQSIIIVELSNMFAKLILQVGNRLFVLGILPSQIKNWLYKSENEYVDLVTLKHEEKLDSINWQNWYSEGRHPALSILDQFQTTLAAQSLFKNKDDVYYLTANQGSLTQKRIIFNKQLLFDPQPSISEQQETIELPFKSKSEFHKNSNGEIIAKAQLASIRQATEDESHLNKILNFTLEYKSPILEIASDAGQQQWIPLIVESGPPGCNNNYSISSILHPNGSFLANYPHAIVLRHLHNKLINVTSIKLHRSIHRRNLNQISEGSVYFRNHHNKTSKTYAFSFKRKEEQVEIPILENQYWNYVIIVPKFAEVKKLPFEIGFISVKGRSLPKDSYQQIYLSSIYKLLDSKQISITNISPISDYSAHVQVRFLQSSSIQNLTSNQNITVTSKTITVQQDNRHSAAIQLVDPDTLISYLHPNSGKLENALRTISRSHTFDFAGFSDTQVYKFVDLVLFYTANIQSQDYFSNIFTKIWNNAPARKYVMSFVQNATETPTIPLPYLKLLVRQLSDQNHINTLCAIAKALPSHRSKLYDSLKGTKYNHLLFETQFYSDYYFKLVQPKSQEKQLPLFSQPLLSAEIAVFKSELTRRLLIKLPSAHYISDITLRIERCDTPSKINYSVFAITPSAKLPIGQGRILQHQWAQITKYSYKPEIEAFFGVNSKYLNVYGLEVQSATAQYLQIQLSFTQTGIVNHLIESGRVPQVDIIPELYGYPTGSLQPIHSLDNLFTFNPEETFFLSVTTIGGSPLQKYSVSKDRQLEYLYFKSQQEELGAIQRSIEEKIRKSDYESLVGLQRRLFSNIKKYSSKVNLDYLYTLLVLTLNELERRSVKLDDAVCDILFKSVVQLSTGPAKLAAFKALSHKVSLLIKSLQYIEADLSTLGKIQFSYDQLLAEVDLTNAELCKSLTRLILRGVAYEQKWAQLLIKMSISTEAHQQIFAYFTPHDDWLASQTILSYIASLSDQLFLNSFVCLLSYNQLCKLVLTPSAKPRLQTLLQIIVEKGSEKNPIDLDVVSLIFQQEQIRWEQLQKVIGFCHQATDTIIHQFLQSDNPEVLASHHNALLVTAASPKYAQEFATFLQKIYQKDKKALRDVFLSIVGKCDTLHYDFLQTIASFIWTTCNFGGVQGVRLVGEDGLAYLQAATEMVKAAQAVPEGAQLPNEQLFIQWYLNNNDYELIGGNPANKTPGYHIMRQLVQLVLQLLRATTPIKVLSEYAAVLQKIKASRRVSLASKHIAYNQLHHGTTQLLSSTLNSGSLSDVLVGSVNPLLATVINQLKSSSLKSERKKTKWNAKQVDISEKFTFQNINQQVKDIQSGKGGTKVPILKLPITQKTILLSALQPQWPSKFVIGFVMNDHLQNKNAILPKKVQLFAGNSKCFIKIGDLQLIQDQFYLSLGIRLFGINLNSFSWIGNTAIKELQLVLHQSLLTAASEVLQNGQKSKKGATYNISFVNISGFDVQPTEEPDYTQLYITLLGFLGQPKYRQDLKKVATSQLFDQKLELIIQVLNDLLPNPQIEQLLLAFNKEGENVLEHVLRSKGANPHLVNLLLLGRLSKENINKLISYTLDNLTIEYVNIVTLTLRLYNYSEASNTAPKSISGLSNITQLLQKYEQAQEDKKYLYSRLITSLLTVPNVYQYQISKLINIIWSKPIRKSLYPILAAVLPYYPQELQNISSNGNIRQVLQELTDTLQYNKIADQVLREPYNELLLISTLIINNSCRQVLLSQKAPIKIVESLRSAKSLLLKYSSQSMKLLISLFQATCIGSNCQDDFSEIIINLMTSLNDFEATHHQYFIEQFFFPLINAFRGVPVLFVWKDQSAYIWQPTEVLKNKPIKSNSKIITHQGKYFSPVVQLDEHNSNAHLIVVDKQTSKLLYQLNKQKSLEVQTNKPVSYSFKQNKLTLEVNGTSLTLPNQKYQILQQSRWEQNLLTNLTLTNLQNPWILEQKYRSVLPIRESTPERCYFLPQQMTVGQLLKHVNISGLRIHPQDLLSLKIVNSANGLPLSHDLKLKDVLNQQKLQFIKLQIQASQIFSSTTIQSLANSETVIPAFVPQQTIFRAFQQKKGLQKLITVLTGCVKNWTNTEQSNIWGQFLKQLESYSCFPVFSSLYMTKQSNVSLLFDLLLGLPDKQDSKKWQLKQKQSVRQLYAIIKDVFAVQGQQALVVRNYALKSGFYQTMLNRLHMITKEPKRHRVDAPEQEQQIVPTLQKKSSEDQYKTKIQKKKGVGYGTDSSTNQKWDLTGQQQARKEQSEQILGLLKILERFLDHKDFQFPEEILEQTFQSALLPIIQSSLRGGSLLQISKYAELFQAELSFIQVLARCKKLIPTLMPVSKNYEPKQPESLHSLLKTLHNTSTIFTSCLTGSASQKVSEEIARKIIATFQIVDEAVSGYSNNPNDEEQQKKILQLPLAKKYPILMKDLRFDYIDMKDSNGKISKHHYASYYLPGHKPPVQKTIRLAQELADVSHALPIDHTNAIFVRCDKQRVDYMQALIMGSNGTPYGHGAYLFDIYFEDNYPNGPPKVNLTTTGSGQIRFNPNLYACGKVCLSLLGTWRGNAMQNWDPKVSTLLQVLVSIQSIIMSEDIYFNEPGFEHEQGTIEGQKKNEAYANIVRYGNIKFAMLQNIKNPPKGFQTIIRRHFYLKKDEILQECQRWLKLADKRQASYNGLVSDHNHNWCNTFKKSKGQYKTLMEKAIKDLEAEINKLPAPTSDDLKKQNSPAKLKKKQLQTAQNSQQNILEEIDVSYGNTNQQLVELDINDERVKDRWSRYIGAMGIQAVSKQSKASILLLGLGALGIQIAKNLVLSGCRELALWDSKQVQWSDLSGQFFLGQSDIGKNRLQSSIYKLQELNHYVKVTKFDYSSQDLANLSKFQVIVATERTHQELIKIDEFCREKKIKFLAVDCHGPYGQIFNDFGTHFEILDSNGEQTTQVLIDQITVAERGIVKVRPGQRHPFEDAETIQLLGVKGMQRLSDQSQSINGTLHKITSINANSFYIGNTLDYSAYQGDGVARNIKTPKYLDFKPLAESAVQQNIDKNLQDYDFTKMGNLKLLHWAFLALSSFQTSHNRLPLSWNREDATQLISWVKQRKSELSQQEIEYLSLFSYTSSGTFGSICAFFGGLASQQIFKAITGKYTPIHQYFLADFSEIAEKPPKDAALWDQFVALRKPSSDRKQGIRRIIGDSLIEKLQSTNVFMIGSGAIGCQLLKNFAMLQVGASQSGRGSIVITDPDHIETSNLNRQFLFRQKHLRKPKSATAAAAVTQMNPRLKGHIKARLDKVCESTKDIYNNDFYQKLTIVTNALDNVEARRYVDSRCVDCKVPLLQSGTLSSKGHVQVIIPYKTQTYGNKQDPNDANGQIPHCTLKMFPEQALHCVEWARDFFGKQFTLAPKALAKLLETKQNYTPVSSDIEMLKDCLKTLQHRPTNFEEAIDFAAKLFYQTFRNDILQLLYTYPLDAVTKDGKPFWKLPKRPPTPIEAIVPENPLHATFITSYAVLLSKIYKIPYPKDFRDAKKRQQLARMALTYKPAPFVPSDKTAKQMTQQVNNQNTKQKQQQPQVQVQVSAQQGQVELFQKFKTAIDLLKEGGESVECRAEQFEKDEDQNGHIDLIYSMANLRSINYKLDQMDWINVKLKAGRITPALSTTTSCIAALQTIELVKYIKGCSVDQMRNTFLNLAVPILRLGEPGPIQQIKVHENLTTNIWERWTVGPLPKTTTFGALLTAIQQKYNVIVKCLTLLQGGQIYSDIVLGLESKKAQKQKRFSKSIKDIISDELGVQQLNAFVDLTLVMAVGETLIKHAPTLRLLFES